MGKQFSLFGDEVIIDKKLDGKYSSKVKTPVYEPKLTDPNIYQCYNHQKFLRLCNLIDRAEVSKEEKEFLKLAATRFIEFNYEYIADYYACANKTTQELFEKLALVIIDFDKAIESGFIQINDQLRTLYEQELD